MNIEIIYNRITEAFINDPVVIAKYGLVEGKTFNEQFSIVSIERILFYDMATNMAFNYQSLNQHAIDVDKQVNEKKAHRPNWYAMMSRLFKYGYNLVEDTDSYDNSALTEEEIQASQVIKFAAAISRFDKSILYIKVATEVNGEKTPLSVLQHEAFESYLSQIQDAGVKIKVINSPADEFYLEMDVYYNPLILDKQGKRLDGSNDKPVQDAIKYYINNLSFNGLYTNAQLVDAVQKVTGVEFPELQRAASRYGVYQDFSEINAKEVAHAGYYTIKDENLKLKFFPYNE